VNLLLAVLLISTSFAPGATVPVSMIAAPCGGENISPQVRWEGAPAGTVSWALILHDPDAPHPGGFYHWVAYGLPAGTRMLRAGETLADKRSGRNDAGSTGYFGPCPPPGKLHHYVLTLYALDRAIEAPSALTAAELLQRIRGHVLAQASLTVVLKR